MDLAPRRLALIATSLLLSLTGCAEIFNGVLAYRQGEFHKALGFLEPIAQMESAREPKVEAVCDFNTPHEKLMLSLTQDYFAAWEAYAGSLFGIDDRERGCAAVHLALRPITLHLHIQGSAGDRKFDPREGDFWQAEVFTLRSWEKTIPCPRTEGS